MAQVLQSSVELSAVASQDEVAIDVDAGETKSPTASPPSDAAETSSVSTSVAEPSASSSASASSSTSATATLAAVAPPTVRRAPPTLDKIRKIRMLGKGDVGHVYLVREVLSAEERLTTHDE